MENRHLNNIVILYTSTKYLFTYLEFYAFRFLQFSSRGHVNYLLIPRYYRALAVNENGVFLFAVWKKYHRICKFILHYSDYVLLDTAF